MSELKGEYITKRNWGGKRPNQTGRPKKVKGGSSTNIYLDAKTKQILKRLAPMNKSEAIRFVARFFDEASKETHL